MPKRKIKLKDYEEFKRLRKEKTIKQKHIPDGVAERCDIGRLQVLAWSARYKAERRMEKMAKDG